MSRFVTESNKTIKEYLESNSVVFKIPLNQRKYSWKKEQVEQYWYDIKKNNGSIINVVKKKL
ncbi:hypothetical protein BBF96_01365 [Anoxybacter fermentans]|uniref:DUF262 domain-containing protein n=1 Tax=Anoxybacter fermentans TaxID=1323375 RepID=A0A3Q9HQ75_9FIRM|nr:hypothetical protein [Anoxybacter fermentans]AZR72159.1 hypothetical protein BBF96_01365 [Anoxybacter fermentans]